MENRDEFKREVSRFLMQKDPRSVDGVFDAKGNVNFNAIQLLANKSPDINYLYRRFLNKQDLVNEELLDLFKADPSLVKQAELEIRNSSVPIELSKDMQQHLTKLLREANTGKVKISTEDEPLRPMLIKNSPDEETDEEIEEKVMPDTWVPQDTDPEYKRQQPFVERPDVKYIDLEGEESDVSPAMNAAWAEIRAAANMLLGTTEKPHLNGEMKKLAEQFIAETLKKRGDALNAMVQDQEEEE